MSALEIFWLAKYAYATLEPLMGPLDTNLRIELVFSGEFPGIDIWVHPNNRAVDSDFQTGVTTWQAVEAFATELQAKASVTA